MVEDLNKTTNKDKIEGVHPTDTPNVMIDEATGQVFNIDTSDAWERSQRWIKTEENIRAGNITKDSEEARVLAIMKKISLADQITKFVFEVKGFVAVIEGITKFASNQLNGIIEADADDILDFYLADNYYTNLSGYHKEDVKSIQNTLYLSIEDLIFTDFLTTSVDRNFKECLESLDKDEYPELTQEDKIRIFEITKQVLKTILKLQGETPDIIQLDILLEGITVDCITPKTERKPIRNKKRKPTDTFMVPYATGIQTMHLDLSGNNGNNVIETFNDETGVISRMFSDDANQLVVNLLAGEKTARNADFLRVINYLSNAIVEEHSANQTLKAIPVYMLYPSEYIGRIGGDTNYQYYKENLIHTIHAISQIEQTIGEIKFKGKTVPSATMRIINGYRVGVNSKGQDIIDIDFNIAYYLHIIGVRIGAENGFYVDVPELFYTLDASTYPHAVQLLWFLRLFHQTKTANKQSEIYTADTLLKCCPGIPSAGYVKEKRKSNYRKCIIDPFWSNVGALEDVLQIVPVNKKDYKEIDTEKGKIDPYTKYKDFTGCMYSVKWNEKVFSKPIAVKYKNYKSQQTS